MSDTRQTIAVEQSADTVIRAGLKSTGIGTWEFDLATQRLRVSDTTLALFGRSADALRLSNVPVAARSQGHNRDDGGT